MGSPLAWWVLRRDVSSSIPVRGETAVFATLVLDSDGGIVGAHAAPGAAESLRLALQRATRSQPRRQDMVLCAPGLGGEVGETLSRLRIRAPVSEEEPPDGVEDVFDEMVGHMAGRRQASDPPSPEEWRTLHEQALRYRCARPWERWPVNEDIPLAVELDGVRSRVYAVVLAEGDARQGLGVSPVPRNAGSHLPPPGSAMLGLESGEVPHDLVARGERYGWPAGSPLTPVFVAFDEKGPHELDGRAARALTAALSAFLELDARSPDRPAVGGEPPPRPLRAGHQPSRASIATDTETVLRALRIPRALHHDATEIMRLTDGFCAEHLDAEYGELCRLLMARIARKRPTPLARGDLRTWAAAIIYTVGSVNFLFDASQEPHLTGDQLSALTRVPKSTVANKSRLIRDLLGLRPLDVSLCRQRLLREHPYAWLVEVDGLIVDARDLPPEMRAEAVHRGLIPDLDGGRA